MPPNFQPEDNNFVCNFDLSSYEFMYFTLSLVLLKQGRTEKVERAGAKLKEGEGDGEKKSFLLNKTKFQRGGEGPSPPPLPTLCACV